MPTYPGLFGVTNWFSPSYSPRTGLFYVSTYEEYADVFDDPGEPVAFEPGQTYSGGNLQAVPGTAPMPMLARGPINTWHEGNAHGAVKAIEPLTGELKWTFAMHDLATSGILTTGSDVLFVGGREGYFLALDARSGAVLWKVNVGGMVVAAPITYEVKGKQLVAIAAGNSLFAFGLR
jgi:alcohol dehydrogenase (cytochrome c)